MTFKGDILRKLNPPKNFRIRIPIRNCLSCASLIPNGETTETLDLEEACRVLSSKEKEIEELAWQLGTLKKEIHKQGDKYLIGFIVGIEDK